MTLFLQAILILFTARSALAAGPATRPYLLYFPGVGGFESVDRAMLAGLRDGGLNADIQVRDWRGGAQGVPALHAYDHNHQEAAAIAAALTQRFNANPAQAIIIASHSGGGAIAIWVLEQLPPDVHVNTVLLLAPAISPDYDLSRALIHVNGKLILFWSTGDELILGIGCRLCGTMDGKMTAAAGRVGFTRPPSADITQYQKLDQHPYDPAWAWLGNFGDHIGPMSRRFARQIITPLLLGN